VEGDGRTVGTADAIKVCLTASDIQLTGYANCGPRGVGANGIPEDGAGDDAHQDGAQIQGGNKVEFIDFEFGDWGAGTATCQGAAGTFVPGSVNGNPGAGHGLHPLHERLLQRRLPAQLQRRLHGPRLQVADREPRRPDGAARQRPDRALPLRLAACLAFPNEATTYVVLGNYCDPWPYEEARR
jgi:hypothetical protein